MFTLYWIVKRSITESVPDRASVDTRNAAFEAVLAPEHDCSAPLLKLERSVSDHRFLKRSKSSLNAFIGARHATEPRIRNHLFKSNGSITNCMTDRACVHTGNAPEQFLHHNETIIFVHTVPVLLLKRSKNL